ncbi:MAG: hypothetical protein R3F46_10435 [bacterium]
MRSFARLAILLLSLLALAGHAIAQDSAEPSLAEGNALATLLLGQLSSALDGIEREAEAGNELARRIQYDLAIQSLVSLQQLLGIDWAGERLAELLREPDCPDLHIGYSTDRRLLLRIEPLELQNPAFAGQLILLCTLESLDESDITTDERGLLELQLLDGSRRSAELLDSAHPLWEHLRRQADSFSSPDYLLSGHNLVFKQLYSAPAPGRDSISAVSLDWASHHFTVEWLENEVTD